MVVNFDNIFEYPITISWEITGRCNYKCIHCRMDNYTSYDYTQELTIIEIENELIELKKCGIQQINFSGGEPFSRNDFVDILHIASNLGFQIGITTNGSYIDKRMAITLREIKKIDLIQISLDGINSETHDFIRGVPGAFDKSIAAIKNLKREGIRTGAVTTVMNYNKAQIEGILRLLLELNVDAYGARRFMPVGKGSLYPQNLLISKKDYYEHCRKWAELVNRYGKEIQLFIEEPLMGILKNNLPESWVFSGCIGGRTYGAIMSNGDVRACIFLPISLGNIRQQSFKNIWHKKERKDFLKENVEGECKECSLKCCCGGCRAMAYLQSGILSNTDPMCFKNMVMQ